MGALLFACLAVAIASVNARQTSDSKKIDPALHIVALDPRWSVVFESAPAAPAGFDEHTAYVPLKTGSLVAVDIETGTVRWTVEQATAFTPATGDGFVFAAGDAVVIAFEDRTGKTAWRTPVGGPLSGPVHFDAGLVIASKADGEVGALRAEDGSVVWRRTLEAPVVVAPSTSGERLFVGIKGGKVLALDRDTGNPLWTFSAGEDVTGLLALEEQLVVGTRGNHVYSFNPTNGRVRWDWRVGGDVTGPAAADDKHIYFAARDNVLRAVDRNNGNLRWKQALPSRPTGGPMRTGDVVIMPTVAADIGAYWATTGKVAFTIKAAGELGGMPYLRENQRPTAPRMVAISREGTLQGFASRFEPPAAKLEALPGGAKIGS